MEGKLAIAGLVLAIVTSIVGFLWNAIGDIQKENLVLQGQIQTLNAKILPVDQAITRTEYELSRERSREDLEQLKQWQLEEAQRVAKIEALVESKYATGVPVTNDCARP